MKPADPAKTAMRLAKLGGPKRPRESDLREAVAAIYYAYFHAASWTVADLWVGATPAVRDSKAWYLAYRSLQHRRLREICSNAGKMSEFPEEIREFAAGLVSALRNRIRAHYDPWARFYRHGVVEDANEAERLIRNFMKAPREDRLAFVTMLALPERKD